MNSNWRNRPTTIDEVPKQSTGLLQLMRAEVPI